MSESEEIWRTVPGWEGLYEISTLGRLKAPAKTLTYIQEGKPRTKRLRERILKPWVLPAGYHHVTLHNDKRNKSTCYHQIVMLAFVGPCPEGMEVCHNDGNPSINRLDNLCHDTRSANHLDKVSHDTSFRGEKHPLVKLQEKQVLEIVRRLKKGEMQKSLAEEYGIGSGAICAIWTGKNWSWLTGRPYM